MSLSVYLKDPTSTYDVEELYWANITHNLAKMASEANLYEALWRPYRLIEGYDINKNDHKKEYEFENSVTIIANFIIEPIEKGLKDLKDRPEYFKTLNSPNGWGTYKHFVPFVEKYLKALKEFPNAIIEISR